MSVLEWVPLAAVLGGHQSLRRARAAAHDLTVRSDDHSRSACATTPSASQVRTATRVSPAQDGCQTTQSNLTTWPHRTATRYRAPRHRHWLPSRRSGRWVVRPPRTRTSGGSQAWQPYSTWIPWIDIWLPRDFSRTTCGRWYRSSPPQLGQRGLGSRVHWTRHAAHVSSMSPVSSGVPLRSSSVPHDGHTISRLTRPAYASRSPHEHRPWQYRRRCCVEQVSRGREIGCTVSRASGRVS
jgi:hypothetical protein